MTQTPEAEASLTFKVACRVKGKIQVYFVSNVPDWRIARSAVEAQVFGAKAVLCLIRNETTPTVAECA